MEYIAGEFYRPCRRVTTLIYFYEIREEALMGVPSKKCRVKNYE